MTAPPATTHHHDERRESLLQAAMGVFFRYGCQKTSMDDVARAAGISRQGLYRHFASKEELFSEVVHFVVARAEQTAVAALDDDDVPLPARLEAAFLAWSGLHFAPLRGANVPYIHRPPADEFTHMSTSAHVAELLAAAAAPLGSAFEEARRRFGEAIARALRRSGVASSAKEARERALTLEAAATGLKHTAVDQASFLRDMRVCIRIVVGDGGGT